MAIKLEKRAELQQSPRELRGAPARSALRFSTQCQRLTVEHLHLLSADPNLAARFERALPPRSRTSTICSKARNLVLTIQEEPCPSSMISVMSRKMDNMKSYARSHSEAESRTYRPMSLRGILRGRRVHTGFVYSSLSRPDQSDVEGNCFLPCWFVFLIRHTVNPAELLPGNSFIN
jgi:hypothetical protein